MIRLLREILKGHLYLGAGVFFLTLSSPHPALLTVLHFLTFPVFLILCLLRMFSPPRGTGSLFLNGFAVLLLWFWIQQAALHAGMPFFGIDPWWTGWLDFFGIFAAAAVYALAAEEAFSERDSLIQFLKFFIFSGSAAAVYFIYIFYTSGVPVEKIQPPFILLEHLGPLGPVSFQPNNFIDLLIPPFFFSLAFIFYNHRRKLNFPDPSRAYSEIFLNLLFVCVLLAGILFTKSRAGIMAFLPSIAFFSVLFWMAQKRRSGAWKIVVFAGVAAVVFLCTLGVKDIVREMMTIKQTLFDESQIRGLRSLTIGASWQLVQEKGWVGVGLGNLPMAWVLFHSAPFTAFPQRSYNDLLWFWVEAGLPGVLLTAALIASVFLTGIRLIRKSQSSFVTYLCAAVLASLTAFILHAMVDPTLYVNVLLWEAAIAMGIIGGLRHLEGEETRDKRLAVSKPPHAGRARFLAVLMLIMLLPLSLLSAGKIGAAVLLSKAKDVSTLELARKLDFLNPYYPRMLAPLYFAQYLENPGGGDLEKSLGALDDAIERDPLNVSLYRKKAEILYHAGDTKRGDHTFVMMQERLPDFYLGNIVMFAFYWEQSLAETDPVRVNRYQTQALRNYMRSLELNPHLSKHRELNPHLSAAGLESFQKTLQENSLS